MRKTILSLITLLVGVVTASAQPESWNYVGDNAYGYSHVVYAGLVNSSGTALTDITGYWLGAFIDGECRGVAQAEQYPSQGDPEFMYFTMRIRGEATDNGKAVTFRLMTGSSTSDGLEYVISGSQSLTYSNEGTTGKPSSLFTLTFEQPRYFTFPENIEVKVGESVDLKSLITFEPTNASVPAGLGEWDFANSYTYINVSNDTLKGLSPTGTYGAWLGMPRAIINSIKSNNGNYSATVKVIQPATGITIKSEYATGNTVYVGDSETLTNILDSCYTLTPADANEEVKWTWSPENGITIDTDDDGGKKYNPTTAGEYKMEAKVGDYSATMALTVLNRVESITAVADTIHLFVGDNLSEMMPHTVAFSPSEYVNTQLECGVKNGATEALQEVNSVWSAVAEGEATLVVTSPEQPNSPVIIPIVVHPNVTDVEIYEKTLTYEYNPSDTTHITRDVMNNFTFIPGKDYTLQEGELTTSTDSVCGIEYHSNGNIWYVYTDKLGSSTLTVTHSAKRTTLSDGALTTNIVTATGSFVVNVVQGLSGFAFDEVVMGRNDSHALTLTPEPENAEFDGSLITVQVNASNLPQDWTLATVTSQSDDNTGLNWNITPQAVGTGMIVVKYNGQIMSRQPITIGQSFTQKEGWAWVTPYGGSVESIEKLYGDNLQEMRSQTEVMYNDPQYGYFGALTRMSSGQNYKVKIKEGQSVEAFNDNVDYSYETASIGLGDKWNWIGFPYQFDHALTDVLNNPTGAAVEFAAGDRIVSKDDGFTEYDGASWDGDLTTLKAGEGYMFYNASGSQKSFSFQSEANLGQPSALVVGPSNAKAYRANVWQYNSSKFADNMTIVADLGAEYASSRYSVGAFIGDECRGEGSFVNGKWFITVHGDANDQDSQVSFRVYDTMAGSTRLVNGLQPYSAKAGSLRAPLRMTVGNTTGISTITADTDSLSEAEIYTIDGQRVSGKPANGVYVVRQNGKARKIVVK